LAFDEIQVLADHYRVSIDKFFGLRTDAFLFAGNLINRERFEMSNYLEGMANQLAYFANAEQKHMYYFTRDIPFFTFLCFLNWLLLNVISGAVIILTIQTFIKVILL